MDKVRNYKWDSNVANRFKMAVIRNLKASYINNYNITDIKQSSSVLVDNLATNLNMTFSTSVLPMQTWRSSVHLVVVTNPKYQNTHWSTINHWFKYMQNIVTRYLVIISHGHLFRAYVITCSPYRNWSSKIYDVISSAYCGFDVVFDENALHHPALPLYVQEHSMLKYQRTCMVIISLAPDPWNVSES